MAIRYTKTVDVKFRNFSTTVIGASGAWINSPTAAGRADGLGNGISFPTGRSSLIHVAPSRYSSVRKVKFWMTLMFQDGNAASTFTASLKIGPASSQEQSRVIQTRLLAPGSDLPSTPVTGNNNTPWQWLPNDVLKGGGANPAYPNSLLYSKYGPSTVINGGNQIPPNLTDGDFQVLELEFDRFDPSSADFFTDWDSIANLADDDLYVAYAQFLAIQLSTWTAGKEIRVKVTGSGCAITQAPSPTNNTCTVIAIGMDGAMRCDPTALKSAFETDASKDDQYSFKFHANEWDGITSITAFVRGATGTGTTTIDWELHEFIPDGADSTVASGSFTVTASPGDGAMGIQRTTELLPFIQDGMNYSFDYKMNGSGNGGRLPFYLEIIQKDFNKTVTFFDGGSGTGAPLQNSLTTHGQGSYFDPASWFEDFPDDAISARRIHGSLLNVAAGSQNFHLKHDADMDARDHTPDSSGSALSVEPGMSGSGEGAETVWREFDITSNDPLDLIGPRKLYIKSDNGLDWQVGSAMLTAVLSYAMTVPNTEVPELGPLFPLDPFDPEGCASTAAGLGDPGVLIITNGSTLPQKYDPTSGLIEDAGIPQPFEGEVPSPTTDDIGASPTSGLELGIYRYRYTFRNCCTGKESNPNDEDIVVDTSGNSPAAEVTLSFAGVRIPGDTQICEICVYRTLVGGDFPIMAKVGCFDPNDTELFVDTVPDSLLDFTNDSLSQLNAPMPCVPIVVEFRNRLFGMGDIPSLSPAGTVSVVQGSDIVTGSFAPPVEWTRCLEGKYIQVEGDCRKYEILKVLPPEAGTSPGLGRLKLVEEYEGSSATGLAYTICGRPNRLYFSEPLEPEYWPEINFLDVEPGDGDRLMGAASNFNRLVICKRNKTYVLTFDENPLTEVTVPIRISSDIGCIAPRSFAQVENGTVWLADRGLALFDGRGVQHVPASAEMNEIFTDPDNARYVRRDRNGRVIGAVGAFYPAREQYLLLLPTVQTDRGANLMLVWDTKLQNITLLEFCQEFMSMVVAKDSDGNERVYLGDTNGFVWLFDIGHTDGVGFPNATGTIRGTVTDAGADPDTGVNFLDDSTASFIEGGLPALAGLSGVAGLSGAFDGTEMGLSGVCLYTRVAGAALDDPWTVRTVFAATPTRLYVTPAWLNPTTGEDETPAVGDDYMLGPIRFTALFKPMNYGSDDFQKRDWRQVLTFDPETVASQLRIELLPDLALSDPEEGTVLSGEPPNTGPGRVFDLSQPKGRLVHPVGRLIHNYMAVRMSNFAPDEPIRIINHALCIEPQRSR